MHIFASRNTRSERKLRRKNLLLTMISLLLAGGLVAIQVISFLVNKPEKD